VATVYRRLPLQCRFLLVRRIFLGIKERVALSLSIFFNLGAVWPCTDRFHFGAHVPTTHGGQDVP